MPRAHSLACNGCNLYARMQYPTAKHPSCPCDRVDFKSVPEELDLISMDCYAVRRQVATHSLRQTSSNPLTDTALLLYWLLVLQKPSYENASMELAYSQAYYRENIFPSLRPHQKVLLVPVSRVQPTLYLASYRHLGMCLCPNASTQTYGSAAATAGDVCMHGPGPCCERH